MRILAVFFAVLAVVAASKPVLFCAVTMSTSKNFATASHLTAINLQSGTVNDLRWIEVEISITTSNGISAYDLLNGVYYYATDGNSAFVFRGNVKNQTLMSPLAFPLDYISELTYDVSQQRIIVAGSADKQGNFLISFPTDESKPWSVISKLDTDSGFECGTVDSANQIYYWLTTQKVNNTFSNVFLNSISLTNPKAGITTNQVMCAYPMLYPDTIRYDPVAKQLYVFAADWIVKGVEVVYYFEKLSTTGACRAVKTQIPGIVADWAYDPITQNVYAAIFGDNGNYIYTLNVKTGNLINNMLVSDQFMPDSMEFAYV